MNGISHAPATVDMRFAIVPAFCVLCSRYLGDCSGGSAIVSNPTPADAPSLFCGGNDLHFNDNACRNTFIQACIYDRSSSACVVPPLPSFSSFTTNNPPGTLGGGSFAADGHLVVKSSLALSGTSVYVYWNVSSAQGCTVSGTKGYQWTTASFGSNEQTSSPIMSQTNFTPIRVALPEAISATVTKGQTASVIPTLQEQ